MAPTKGRFKRTRPKLTSPSRSRPADHFPVAPLLFLAIPAAPPPVSADAGLADVLTALLVIVLLLAAVARRIRRRGGPS
jgi:hypothetical protein